MEDWSTPPIDTRPGLDNNALMEDTIHASRDELFERLFVLADEQFSSMGSGSAADFEPQFAGAGELGRRLADDVLDGGALIDAGAKDLTGGDASEEHTFIRIVVIQTQIVALNMQDVTGPIDITPATLLRWCGNSRNHR